jgi:exo-beta-1,3-glucanase (GH17 family)
MIESNEFCRGCTLRVSFGIIIILAILQQAGGVQEISPGMTAGTWNITQNGTIIEINYGSGTNFPQFAALHTESSYLRLVAPDTNWGTSIVLLPSFWENGTYYQGAPVKYEWHIDNSDIVFLLNGEISNLTAKIELRISPPLGDTISANVSVNVTGNAKLDARAGEAYKTVMLSSMHIPPDLWDARSAYVDSREFTIPEEGWISWPPVKSKVFGLKGGSSSWKKNAPLIEIRLNDSYGVTGWVTKDNNPNNDNVGFWAASDEIVRNWDYMIKVRKEIKKTVYLKPGWNMISVPLDIITWELGEVAKVGNPFNENPENCLSSIYRYNSTYGLFEKSDHFDNWGWYPATGSESFTALEPGKGYWVVAKSNCNLTFIGVKPSNLTITLKEGWNFIGYYSRQEALLGEEEKVGNPLNTTPKNSLTSIYRYNTTSGQFEKSDHFDDWGWWPATGSENFKKLEPGKGYWVVAKNKSFLKLISRPPVYVLNGIDFSPYIDGQDPNSGSPISEEQLRTRLDIVEPYTQWIRTFGSGNGLEKAGMIAHEMGLKTAIGAWLGKDLTSNENEISNLIDAAKAGDVDIAIVGSEVLLRGDLSESQLVEYINRVKNEVPAIQVTTADVYGEFLSHPAVVNTVDVVFVNYYPYWENIGVNHAVASIHGWHQLLTAKTGGKPVIVSETGWPSCGDRRGDAVPSPENASFYFLNFVSWARANNVSYFYFEAFDENWKAAYEGPQGACWGIWDKNGQLKTNMQEVFDGKVITDNWSGTAIPGGPGNATIELTFVPPYGSSLDLKGQVWHVRSADNRVVVYIKVGSGWWIKPYWDSPLTIIWPDGSWTCDITTGGNDPNATAIAAYLIPNNYIPPSMSGGSTLPAELEQNSLAKVEKMREP